MKAFKIKNGLQAGRYLGSNGTETAGTLGYDLGSAVYDGVSFSVSAQETSSRSVFFKPDGTKVYTMGVAGDDVNEYGLGTAWDITTASYTQSFSVSSQEISPSGLFFKSDGTKMYVVGEVSDSVNEYTLSTAWDISTATYTQLFVLSGQDLEPLFLFFKPDGLKMYVSGNVGNNILEYNLSTAWDVSSLSFLQSFNVTAQDTVPAGIFFKPDGTIMYMVGAAGIDVNEYTLTTGWDISTASYLRNFPIASAQETSPYGISLKTDGTKMYIIGNTSDTIFQYSISSYTQALDLSTGTTFSFTPSGATTVSFTNPPATGIAIGFTVEIIGDASAITWPSSVKWPAGVAPTATATKELYTFVTTDGGTTYYGKKAAEGIS